MGTVSTASRELILTACFILKQKDMGWDAKLILKENKNESINCDRGYNLINSLTDRLGISDKLQSEGLTKDELCDILEIMIDIKKEPSMSDEILENLNKYEDSDVFVLVDWDF